MTGKMCPLKTGLAVGISLGILHLLWAILVATQKAKALMDWFMNLHFVESTYVIRPFSAMTAVKLVIVTTIVGFVLGYLFGMVWNCVNREKK